MSKQNKKEKASSVKNNLFKGCNCKRTKCQKNFCECYKNSKLCTEFCKCIDCQNCPSCNAEEEIPLLEVVKEETFELQDEQVQVAEEGYIIQNEMPISCYAIAPKKKRLNVLTGDIIESTMECVISQAEECQTNNVNTKTAELLILEEFGRCLDEVRRLTNMQHFLG
ncbi:protein lin-54 homolog [Bradysia coprophila]|uniref:protein lin-54 homolog n=1 Tax=Bradysia coprophila TaxID=38358 RepID=UPI00187D9D02|nr:protein lin-54 homolog [Bradysia coprophila]